VATPTIPRDADELAEALGDTATLKAIAKDKDSLQEFITGYAKAQSSKDPGIEAQIREETQRQFADILRDDKLLNGINRLNLDPTAPPVARSKHYNAKAPGAALDKTYGNWGDYLSLTWQGANTQESLAARSDIKKIQNAFGSTVPSDGGFLIPEVLRAELLRVALEMAVVRSRARVVPMESLTVPYPMIDNTSNASSVHGGIVGYWTEEGGTLTDSSPTFGRIELIAKKLTLYSEIPNELFQDSIISLEQFMNESYPEALAWFEDVAFTDGNGVGQPLGFLNAAGRRVRREGDRAGRGDDPVGEHRQVLQPHAAGVHRPRGVGRAHRHLPRARHHGPLGRHGRLRGVDRQRRRCGRPAGHHPRPPRRVHGEGLQTSGTAGDINFVDFGYYLIGDRQAMQADTSPHYKFGNDKTAMRFIERVDGTPWLQSAITPRKGANTLSPFVKVASR
jgi:HK97 family phage major capsid protein